MFCVECGKEGPIFREGVCKECYLKTHSFSKGPRTIELPVCTHCSSYKYKNTWTSDIFDEVIRRVIKNTFHISNELKKIDIATECTENKEGKTCKIIISGFLDESEITEEHNLLVRMNKTVCDVCSKRSGGYHEAVLQIRADKRKPTRDELHNIRLTVEHLVESLQAKGNRSLFITDIDEKHRRLDFYLSEKGAALTITKHIQEQYGGQIKTSSKNIGMKDSRQIYRMTYLIRLPAYTKGNFIFHDNTFYHITSIHGNKVYLLGLQDWKEKILEGKELQKASILGGKELIKEMIVVSQTNDEVQVMDQETYEIKIIKKPRSISFDLEKIKTVEINGQIFLFPEKNMIIH